MSEHWRRFVDESNTIEGIVRDATDEEVRATEAFVMADIPTIESLTALARVYAPTKGVLRDHEGMNVRVGNHVAPRGGPHIKAQLASLLKTIEDADPFQFHVQCETLHPFCDGNGRTGRTLWAWQMWRLKPEWVLELGFLHSFYYQTLSAERNQ